MGRHANWKNLKKYKPYIMHSAISHLCAFPMPPNVFSPHVLKAALLKMRSTDRCLTKECLSPCDDTNTVSI